VLFAVFILALAVAPAAHVGALWAEAWQARGQEWDWKVLRRLGMRAGLGSLPGLFFAALAADGELGMGLVAIGVTLAFDFGLWIGTYAGISRANERARARAAIAAGRDVERSGRTLLHIVAREHATRTSGHEAGPAELACEDAMICAAAGRLELALRIVHAAGRGDSLTGAPVDAVGRAIEALELLSKGEADEALERAPADDPAEATPGRVYELAPAVRGLALALSGQRERAAPLLAAQKGERPFVGALRALGRAHAAAARGERDRALAEIDAVLDSRYPEVLEQYSGPASALAREAAGPYRG
jgi:tetratricopeptide (TPR) repeat protein